VIRRDLGTDRDERVLADAELDHPALRLDLGDGEVAALSLADIANLALTSTKLERDVTVSILGTMGDDLTIVDPQHSDRHMFAGLAEDSGHSDLLCDHTGAHRRCSYSSRASRLQLDLDVDACGQV
jgi:hypothetical protein